MEQPYSKRETDMLLKRIDENIKEGFEGVHERLDIITYFWKRTA